MSDPVPATPKEPDRPALVAVDLGAGSCRVALLRWIHGRPAIQFAHRFSNGPVEQAGSLRWDIERIYAGVEEGLRLCASLAPEGIASIGIDGWAVDYVRLGSNGLPLASPFCYRDTRNVAAEDAVHAIISPHRLYALTGVQRLRFNTIYQLYADRLAGVPDDSPWVNLPEYLLHRLGGRRVAEYTNATHSGLVDLQTKNWSEEIFRSLQLDLPAAPPLVSPGTDVGKLIGPLTALPPFQSTRLIAPACHDTASSIAGIPASRRQWAYISSGTWSLVGTVLDQPCITAEAQARDFTNLGAAGGRICFHKNVNGMWLIQQCIEAWKQLGRTWTVPELIEHTGALPRSTQTLEVDAPHLMLPGDMPRRINQQLCDQGLLPLAEDPQNAPHFASLIFHSLAARYANTLDAIARITGQQLRDLYIVGGGSQNRLLNRLTEEATGLAVHCCQVESSTTGNFAVQLAASDHPGQSPTQAALSEWAKILGDAAHADSAA
jgi:rhamnulokinase